VPRIRTIKPEFPQSESMGRVSREARLCFVLLWTILDDEGRARGSSRMLASLLYPYDDDAPKKIEGWLAELEQENCVVRYKVDGDSYIASTNWEKHQKIDKPSKSRLPSPIREASREIANIREVSSSDLVPRTVDLGPSISSSKPPIGDFEGFWLQCPRKVGKGEARKAYASAITRTSPATIEAGMRAYAASRAGQDEKFTVHPATWLRADRWLDEAPKPNGNGAALVALDPFAKRLAEIEGHSAEDRTPTETH
jgi:hypothetical protein